MDKDLIPTQLEGQLAKYRVDADQARSLLTEYGAPFTEAGEILASYATVKVTDEDDTATMKLAREQRLKLRSVRVGVENKRKELKEDILKRGNAIDGVARFVKEVIAPAEEYLQLQEDYAKIKAAERAAAAKAYRIEELSQFTNDYGIYDLDAITDEQFAGLIDRLRTERDAHIAAETKAQDEARERAEAEHAEQERMRTENERLRAEAQVEREARAEAERLEKAERERLQAKADAERKKREKLERAQLNERLAKEKVEREAAERARQELLAPDKEKFARFSNALGTIRAEKLPQVESVEASALVDLIDDMLAKMQAVIAEKSDQL